MYMPIRCMRSFRVRICPCRTLELCASDPYGQLVHVWAELLVGCCEILSRYVGFTPFIPRAPLADNFFWPMPSLRINLRLGINADLVDSITVG